MNKEILNYIPHRRTMVLVDQIVSKDKDNFAVQINIKELNI